MRNEPHLSPRSANARALSPVDFLERAAEVSPDKPAVAWRDRRWSYRAFRAQAHALAAALRAHGVGEGDVVSIIASNRPEMLAAHYAAPMIGAVLNAINTRLDAETIAYILDHSESRLLLLDPACAEAGLQAARAAGVACLRLPGAPDIEGVEILDVLDADPAATPNAAGRDGDEWAALCLNYTSGTTGRPKGVVYRHRGAYLNALGNVSALGLDARSVYLWTLPMFHCNGWCHTWAVTAARGLHVCLDRPDPALIFAEMARHAVSHFSCAPVVLYMMVNHPHAERLEPARRVTVATGGAAPTSALIEQLDALGFDLIHLYGLTESYGPATLCALGPEAAGLDAAEKARLLARQGLPHVTFGDLGVLDAEGCEVAHDGAEIGEIVLRGNTLLAGYYRDPEATEAAFKHGAFHTGDLAVRHPGGAIEIKDRAKDVIISGGENVSSLEVETVLHRHPAVMMAAVVAAPHPKWGETPVAFIELKPGAEAAPEELEAFCRERLAGFKRPRRFLFRELPKTATGKVRKFELREIAHDDAATGGAGADVSA